MAKEVKKMGYLFNTIENEYEHRLVAEKMLGRKLKFGETVHHRNQNILDNREENLFVFKNPSQHMRYHHWITKNYYITEEEFMELVNKKQA